MSEDTIDDFPRDTKFKKGHPGGPGRAKGSRNKLSNAFISALSDDFEGHGIETIQKLREDRPDAYMSIIGRLMPKLMEIELDAHVDVDLGWEVKIVEPHCTLPYDHNKAPDQVLNLSTWGLPDTLIAAFFHITLPELEEWQKDHPDFREALLEGRRSKARLPKPPVETEQVTDPAETETGFTYDPFLDDDFQDS